MIQKILSLIVHTKKKQSVLKADITKNNQSRATLACFRGGSDIRQFHRSFHHAPQRLVQLRWVQTDAEAECRRCDTDASETESHQVSSEPPATNTQPVNHVTSSEPPATNTQPVNHVTSSEPPATNTQPVNHVTSSEPPATNTPVMSYIVYQTQTSVCKTSPAILITHLFYLSFYHRCQTTLAFQLLSTGCKDEQSQYTQTAVLQSHLQLAKSHGTDFQLSCYFCYYCYSSNCYKAGYEDQQAWVVFPEPVSPDIISTRLSLIALVMTSFIW